jgi:hypothetical protein
MLLQSGGHAVQAACVALPPHFSSESAPNHKLLFTLYNSCDKLASKSGNLVSSTDPAIAGRQEMAGVTGSL